MEAVKMTLFKQAMRANESAENGIDQAANESAENGIDQSSQCEPRK